MSYVDPDLQYVNFCFKVAKAYNNMPKSMRPKYQDLFDSDDWYCTDCSSDEEGNGFCDYIKVVPNDCDDDYADSNFDPDSREDLKTVVVHYEHVCGPISDWWDIDVNDYFQDESKPLDLNLDGLDNQSQQL